MGSFFTVKIREKGKSVTVDIVGKFRRKHKPRTHEKDTPEINTKKAKKKVGFETHLCRN
jgi:hypothetical protein